MELIRSYNARSQVSNPEGSRTLLGRPIVFGQRSVLLGDWEHGAVYEVVERSAITQELIDSSDIVANINHDDNQLLGRSYEGKGSLELELDDEGVSMRLDAPDTPYGDVAVKGAARGDLRGMSFAFRLDPRKDIHYTKERDADGKDCYVRHIDTIRELMDVSIVTRPAYPSTEVSVRSIEEAIRAALWPRVEPQRDEGAAADIASIEAFLNSR